MMHKINTADFRTNWKYKNVFKSNSVLLVIYGIY